MRIISWNVRTLLDTQSSRRPERRTALVCSELARFKIDVAALSETRLSEEGQLIEHGADYTIFWKGKPASEPRTHGVGFAIKTSLVRAHNLQPLHINERLSSIRIPLRHGHITIISAYAPTLDSDSDVKESFYQSLRAVINSVSQHDKLMLLGDFNARVGRDHIVWPGIIGKQGVGNMNSNGQLLLDLCSEMSLVITNTIFRLRNRDKTTWMHPRSRHWHLIDFAITRQRDRAMVLVTKALRNADDCWTDHRPVFCNIRIPLKPKPRMHGNPPRKKFNLAALEDAATANHYQNFLAQQLETLDAHTEDSEEIWNDLKTTIQIAAANTIGFVKKRHQDWFDENNHQIKAIIDQKRHARREWENDRASVSKESAYRQLKSAIQRQVREIKNSWWERKAEEIQGFADRHESRNFFSAVRAIYGPTRPSTFPVLSKDGSEIIKDEETILNRWTEHFQDLLNRPSQAAEDFLSGIPQLPFKPWLGSLPTPEEVNIAIKQLKSNKSPGPDNIPAELLKRGGQALCNRLHALFITIWESKRVPKDFRDANIVAIFKKGDRANCENYRGISLLSNTGKVLARILLNRLQTLSEAILPESQHGFRPGRGTAEMILCARQLLEKAREQHQPMFMIFFDLKKAFDSVPRITLWNVLRKFGCPDIFIELVRGLHDGMTGSVLYGASNSPCFPIATGVKQGCVLAPTLFSLYLSAVLIKVNTQALAGVVVKFRHDGGLFNLQRLKARSKTQTVKVTELQYADDNCAVATSPESLQQTTNAFVHAYESAGLEVNTDKTKILGQPQPSQTLPPFEVTIHGTNIEQVPKFQYLGTLLNTQTDPSDDINNRIRAANYAYGKLYNRVFSQRGLKIPTKIKVYRAAVVSTLLYGCESATLYRRNIRTLECFHQRKLRNILRIRWEDRITNNEVLTRSGLPSIQAIIAKNQMRFMGHLLRKPAASLPKQILYGELLQGRRPLGRPKKRLKDLFKTTLTRSGIQHTTWEAIACNRTTWQIAISSGADKLERDRAAAAEEKRHRRTDRMHAQKPPPAIQCPNCDRLFYSHFGLHSHLQAHARRLVAT